MSKRGDNIYKRKDGRWEGRIRDGSGKLRSIYGKGYKEVKEKIKAYYQSCAACPCVPSAGNAACYFEEWLADSATRIKASTYESYYYCTNRHILPFFTGERREVTQENANAFVQVLLADSILSPTYLQKILCIFKIALRAISHRHPEISINLQFDKKPSCTVPGIIQVFSAEEQHRIEAAALERGTLQAAGILICLYTGLRLGELCALRWANIDWEARTLMVLATLTRVKLFDAGQQKTELKLGPPKNRSSNRRIPLPNFLYDYLCAHKPAQLIPSYFLLSNAPTPTDPRTCQKLFKSILRQAQVEDRKFHAMRHTFATRLLEAGVDIKTLSELLGHSSATHTLNIYVHSLMEQKKLAIDKLNSFHLSGMKSSTSAVKSHIHF